MEKAIKSLKDNIFWSTFVVYLFTLLWFSVIISNLNNTTDKIDALQESVNKQREEVADLRIYITELEESDGE